MAHIAIIGATGLVGRQMLKCLEEHNITVDTLTLYASKNSAGTSINFKSKAYRVKVLRASAIDATIDVALFSAGAAVAFKYAPLFVAKGITVIDNSSAFRMDQAVPLIVPEVNRDVLKKETKLIANPNCSTIQSVVPLAVIGKSHGLKHVSYTTYQAVSGSGQVGIDALKSELSGKTQTCYPKPIAGNLIPQIDTMLANGFTKEETKMMDETRKILSHEGLGVAATCVRVPVFNGHAVSIRVECDTDVNLDTITKALKTESSIVFHDINAVPTPLDATDQDKIHVGRLRQDPKHTNVLYLWCVADNIRKGAATNAVQILDYILEGSS